MLYGAALGLRYVRSNAKRWQLNSLKAVLTIVDIVDVSSHEEIPADQQDAVDTAEQNGVSCLAN